MQIPANYGSLDNFKAGDGMIYIYTDKKSCSGWIMENDWYFNLYTSNREFTDEDRAAAWQIDRAKVSGDKRIETKYGMGTVRNLSSGCKTLLNVRKNPGKVVNADECGKNVLDILFAMDGISLYMTRPERVSIREDAKICFNGTDVVEGRRGYERWWTQEYERRERDGL